MEKFKNYLLIGLIGSSLLISSCGDDDEVPPEEEELEVITDVTLVFTNTADASDVVRASAEDPDGDGAADLVVEDEITLTSGATYTLTFEIFNNLETPGEDIGEEIEDEDDEQQQRHNTRPFVLLALHLLLLSVYQCVVLFAFFQLTLI